MAKKSRNLFQLLNEIFYGKTPWDDLTAVEKKNFSVYMINRFISMDENYVELIADLQKYTMGRMSAEMVYTLYQDIFPKRKFFKKYIKASGSKEHKYDELVEFLSKEMGWSTTEGFENLELLLKTDIGVEFIKKFLSGRGVSKQEMKKRYKIK